MSGIRESLPIPEELIALIDTAGQVVVLTGSGISAESGVPTFREAQTGLWSQYDPQSLATSQAFRHDPELVWEWYRWRRELISKARPNPGHLALVELETLVQSFSLITQNVDGLHRLAGNSDVIELHGNIMRSRCTVDGRLFEELLPDSDELPYCPDCGELLRPDVVWFGEELPQASFRKALSASQDSDVFLSVGTSGIVQPAASLAIEARSHGGIIVEINVEDTPLTPVVDFPLRGTSGTILPTLVDLLKLRR
ncbi:MAG TPA: NAD-dependent deacylase [candidate division Zixibacteria bacterium]|nr:NAD-dependent deacylase [candidate division Zixibacteria bacterium]